MACTFTIIPAIVYKQDFAGPPLFGYVSSLCVHYNKWSLLCDYTAAPLQYSSSVLVSLTTVEYYLLQVAFFGISVHSLGIESCLELKKCKVSSMYFVFLDTFPKFYVHKSILLMSSFLRLFCADPYVVDLFLVYFLFVCVSAHPKQKLLLEFADFRFDFIPNSHSLEISTFGFLLCL